MKFLLSNGSFLTRDHGNNCKQGTLNFTFCSNINWVGRNVWSIVLFLHNEKWAGEVTGTGCHNSVVAEADLDHSLNRIATVAQTEFPPESILEHFCGISVAKQLPDILQEISSAPFLTVY